MFERFVFDGVSCDEYGIRCAAFAKAGFITVPAQETELNTEKSVLGDTFHIISQDYASGKQGLLSYHIQSRTIS